MLSAFKRTYNDFAPRPDIVQMVTRPDGTPITRVKLYDKLAALHKLAPHTGVIERTTALVCGLR